MSEIFTYISNSPRCEFLHSVMEFYKTAADHPLLMTVLFWLFWPGGMFIVAHLIEHRKVHLGKGQSRMFFPGDFTLGVGTISFIGIHAKSPVGYEWVYGSHYWEITAIFFFVVMVVFRHFDIARYEKHCKNTPTKLAHDFAGYFVCAWLLIGLGLPQLIWSFSHWTFSDAPTEWAIFAGCAAFFIAMTIWDLTHPATADDLLKMHPPYLYPWQRARVESAEIPQ